MKVLKEKFLLDYKNTTGHSEIHLKDFFTRPIVRFLLLFRLGEKNKLFYILQRLYGRKFGLEMKSDNCGAGLKIGHPFNITINPDAVIGKGVILTKGVTIGVEKGKCPIVGNNVRIGANSTITGGISIGDNVVIAPNTFVNFNVPSNTVVVPGKAEIHNRHTKIA